MGRGLVLISIDPGKRTGLATFSDGRLVSVDRFDGDDPPSGLICDRLVVEIPSHLAAPTMDLLTLARRAGLAAGRVHAHACEFVPARRWKGSVEKKAMHARILSALTADEPRSKDSNVLDAIGLGLWALQRLP